MIDFNELYRRYATDVFRFALYVTGNRADAEDITAETFVRAWTSGDEIRSQTVKGFLCTIARNLFLQRRRRESRHVEMPEDLPDPASDPERQAEKSAELRRVVARLQQLPEVDRTALLMRAMENLSYDEIGIALGITAGTARVKVFRARMELEQWRRK